MRLASGCDGPTASFRQVALRRDRLREFLPRANSLPSRDSIRRLLIALEPEAFRDGFRNWARDAIRGDAGTTSAAR